MTHNNFDSIPVELQYIIAKFCGLDYTSVFNLLLALPGLKTYVEAYQHLKQELNKGFLEAKEKHKDGYKVCYFVKGGVRTGEYKRWDENGVLIKHSHYKNNKKEGECKRWYANGQLDIHCFYKNDKLDGECTWWYANGQIFLHCFYKNDNRDGECKWWHNNGQLFKHRFYENGVVTKTSYLNNHP